MKTKIGIEIEVNNNVEVPSEKLWTKDVEHCGYELKSIPIDSYRGFRSLLSSLKGANSSNLGFFNAGNHIHIDFMHQFNPKTSDLVKYRSKKANNIWLNPSGSGRKSFWICNSGRAWKSASDYIDNYSSMTPDEASRRRIVPIVDSVKRFLLIGIRFDLVLLGFQNSDRLFNKYCHTISDWSEKELLRMETIEEICVNPKLTNGHRRHGFNPLSFKKFGTIEIRLMKGSLDPRDVWLQIFLFGKLSSLAKSGRKIPTSTGVLSVDAEVLLNAAGIRGKIKGELLNKLSLNKKNFSKSNCICYSCEQVININEVVDAGLSRASCESCAKSYCCDLCGVVTGGDDNYYCIEPTKYGCKLCMGCRDEDMSELREIVKRGLLPLRGEEIYKKHLDINNSPKTLQRLKNAFK